MSISIPNKAKTAFDGNMNERQTIELPFPCPPFFIINGDEKLEALKNVQYFGGFACTVEKLQAAAENWNDCPFPIPGFQNFKHAIKGSQKLDVLAARSLTVAVIGIRQYSSLKTPDGKKTRVAPFTKGARPGIQVLCVLGFRDENKALHPWAPVMLTASGYQVNHIQDAISSYRKAFKPFVRKLVPDATDSILNLFWMPIGTFGSEPVYKQVGSGADSNSITPIMSFIPQDLDEKKVEGMYVGEPMAEFMSDISEQAKEWLSVFTNMEKAQGANQPAHIEPDYDDVPPPPDDYDQIPF